MKSSSETYRNRALAFLDKVFRTQKHLLDHMHRPGDAQRRATLAKLKNTVGYNRPRYSSENLQRFIRNHFAEIASLIPGEGSGCNKAFIDQLHSLRNEAIRNEQLVMRK